jgi:hypothetical protein
MAEMDDDELLDALGVEVTPVKISGRSAREERMIAGFQDILSFYQTHGRVPLHEEGRDIFERRYALRLDRLRKLPDAHALLGSLDGPGLMTVEARKPIDIDDLDEDALLAELGVGGEAADHNDITVLRHVRSTIEKRAADEIANRTHCADFDKFKSLFDGVKNELDRGIRKTFVFQTRSMDKIQKGTFFIVGGQIAYIDQVGDEFFTKYERRDSRLRVIFDNGTEAEVLQRSLQRALHRDDVARLITEPSFGPLFGDSPEPYDIESGTIYVLRSFSRHPYIEKHRELVHKIGVTGGEIEIRIAGAAKDPTYLMAEVEVVASYKLHNLNRIKLENIFHRLFGAAQIDLTIEDRFGNPVKPREWFLVPLHVIDEAVRRIRDGSITDVAYDPKTAQIVG